jgi:hypothetical protein
MASGMSAGLRLSGLDDFITPSQACIKPVEAPRSKKKAPISITISPDILILKRIFAQLACFFHALHR